VARLGTRFCSDPEPYMDMYNVLATEITNLAPEALVIGSVIWLKSDPNKYFYENRNILNETYIVLYFNEILS